MAKIIRHSNFACAKGKMSDVDSFPSAVFRRCFLRFPTFFISHGGGPWPYVPEMMTQFQRTAQWLRDLPKSLPDRPKAILSISGHWEESVFSVSSSPKPPMIYDYSGFPPNTYSIQYPAPGSPEIAARVRGLLDQNGIPCKDDPGHGLDHGTFVPLFLMYPDADVPVVSMSIKSSYDPAEHIRMGESLQPLREEGVLIIGSGLSYHNMRGFGSEGALPISRQFGMWLQETVSEPDYLVRTQRLLEWEKAPAARAAHPREDHLIPLMVVAGAAGSEKGKSAFVDKVMNVEMASFRFG
jgi:aromatic ring-opening dioxygenase catalytic subunit (LigB family)